MKLLLASVAKNVLERAVPLFNLAPKDCKIVCIPTAANAKKGAKDWLETELNEFRRFGFQLDMMNIDGMKVSEVAHRLETADIIYVTGGNTFFLLEKMKACGFEKTVRAALLRGAIYVGSSAGAVVCCPDIDYVRTMDDPSAANLDNTAGLNLIDFYIMAHMDHPAFASKANDKILEMKNEFLPAICLKDDQALFIDGSIISIL